MRDYNTTIPYGTIRFLGVLKIRLVTTTHKANGIPWQPHQHPTIYNSMGNHLPIGNTPSLEIYMTFTAHQVQSFLAWGGGAYPRSVDRG